MKLTTVVILSGVLLGSGSAVCAQEGAQGGSSASSSTSVEANKSSAKASSNTSTSTSGKAGQSSASLSSGTAMNATLSQPVDAKKNKPGDQVTAKTTEATKSDGKVVIPKGSKLVGHVTECKQRSKEEKESALGIVFDKAILKNSEEIPLNVTIHALAAAQTAAASSVGDDLSAGGGAMGSARASGGGALGGVRSTAGTAGGAVTNTAASAGGVASGAVNSTVNAAGAARGAVGGLNSAGQLTSNSQGVFGLQGLNLNAAAANDTQGSVITSTSRNVHLDSGTQLLLVSQAQAPAKSPNQ
ncbi:MAG TPA: hypothetical protein VN943_13285 [Candidatus Acidoferrum sp.]|nr:hypothetical protein [Candidatus Acidoferrum sp.]